MPENDGEMQPDERLEREMIELGPLVRRRQEAESEAVNQEFAGSLRARLMTMPRADGAQEEARRPIRAKWLRTALPGAMVVAALVVALVIAHPPWARHGVAGYVTSTPVVAMAAPAPSTTDLLRAYPSGAGGGGIVIPEESLFDISGVAYAGHLRMLGATPRLQPRVARAFRLAAPRTVAHQVTHLARILGIHGASTPATIPQYRGLWVVAADGGLPSTTPLHSVAVSLQTGELIYHDVPVVAGRESHSQKLDSTGAVARARRWLAGLGLPAGRMPLLSATLRTQMFPPSAGIPWEVSFGWAGTGPDAIAAATLLVMPNGHVFEARVWPPVAREGHVLTRDIAGAWREVQSGRAPIAVEGMADQQPVNGVATLLRVTVVQLLVTNSSRGAYLVPAYRFQGTARLQSAAGTHIWYALVSAVRQ